MSINKAHTIVGRKNSELGAIELGSCYPVLGTDLEIIIGVASAEDATPDGYRLDEDLEAFVPKSYKYVTSNIEICLDDSEEILDNGQAGDRRRAIWTESDTGTIWIETNGGPEVYETLEDAEEAL